MFLRRSKTRHGAIVPLTAMCLIGLLGVIALCIDLSIVALAKAQCQNAADMAAMAGARSLTGNVTGQNNATDAFTNGNNAAVSAKVLNQQIVASQTNVQIAALVYNTTLGKFEAIGLTSEAPAGTASPSYPPPSGHNWGMAQATISSTVNYNFARIFGLTSMPVTAVAQAIHRPRDVSIIMDYSGSMSFDSYMARPNTGGASSTSPPYASLNNDTRVPRFGHYDINTPYTANSTNPTLNAACLVNSETPSPWAGNYVVTSSNEIYKVGNQTETTNAGSAILEDFFTLTSGGAMVQAFTGGSARSPVTAYDGSGFPTTIPNWSGSLGDRPRLVNTTASRNVLAATTFNVTPGTAYAKTVREFYQPVLTSTTPAATVNAPPMLRQNEVETFAASGTMYPTTTNGFTAGPGYWGKTFFEWPPEPDATANAQVAVTATGTNSAIRDWRQRFFWAMRSDGSGKKRLDDNNVLYQTTGSPRNPTSVYTDPNGVGWTWAPNYDAILFWLKSVGPNPFPGNVRCGRLIYWDAIPDTVANSGTDLNQIFWKNYIDVVTGYNGYRVSGSGMNLLSGYGDDFIWSSSTAPTAINPKPTNWVEIGQLNLGYASGTVAGTNLNVKTPSYQSPTFTMLNWVPPANTQIRFNSVTAPQTYTVQSVTTNVNQWTLKLNNNLAAAISNGVRIFANLTPSYMDYRDNPRRPKHRFWFGAMTFNDFIFGDYDVSTYWRLWRPGNCHEAPMWVLKAGIQSALQDIQKNHPNDWVTTCYFSVPMSSSGDTNMSRRFNRPRGALGKNYSYMQSALWYPPSVINTDGTLVARTASGGEFRPYTSTFGVDAKYRECPNANGGTCPSWGLTLAYNQFSSRLSLQTADSGRPTGTAGGNGRLGARKLVIFETDGVPNHYVTSTFVNSGVGQSYWDANQGQNKYPGVSGPGNMHVDVLTNTYANVATLCDNASGTTAGTVAGYLTSSSTTSVARGTGRPGYSTSSRPVLVHSLAFGGLFESSSTLKPDCLGFLQSVQTIGNVQSNPTTALPSYKIITGTSDERIDSIKTAFTNIMQDGVQITLYK